MSLPVQAVKEETPDAGRGDGNIHDEAAGPDDDANGEDGAAAPDNDAGGEDGAGPADDDDVSC